MSLKRRERAGGIPPARADIEVEDKVEDKKVMPSNGLRTQTQNEGVTVIGEAVRRITPESAEFLIEIASTAPAAAQALRDNHAKIMQLTQSLNPLGVQPADVQIISSKVQSLYSPVMQSLPGYIGLPQIGQ